MFVHSTFDRVVHTAVQILKKESFTELDDIRVRCKILVEQFPPDRFRDGRSASSVLISDYRHFYGRETRDTRQRAFSQFGDLDQTESQPDYVDPSAETSGLIDAFDLIKSRLYDNSKSDRDWVVFEMRFLGQKSIAEIGQILGMSKSTIFRRMKIIRNIVKSVLEKVDEGDIE